VRTGAALAVEARDRRHVLGVQLEVEDVDVLGDPLGRH
jgi:hypothetical protein